MIIQSVHRAMGILSLFSHARSRWGITDIATATGLAKGTVHNIVHTLAQDGFLKQDPETRRYTLGHKIFTLGAIMAGTLEINQKAAAMAHRLSRKTGIISRVAVWDGDAALVTLNATPQDADSLAQQIGPRVDAYCSALGRALLAWLDEETVADYFQNVSLVAFTQKTVTDVRQLESILAKTRELGYATNDQEMSPGQSSIAAPIFQSGGRLAASISLTGRSEWVMGTELPNLVTDLRRAAQEISRYMGYFPAAMEHGHLSQPKGLARSGG